MPMSRDRSPPARERGKVGAQRLWESAGQHMGLRQDEVCREVPAVATSLHSMTGLTVGTSPDGCLLSSLESVGIIAQGGLVLPMSYEVESSLLHHAGSAGCCSSSENGSKPCSKSCWKGASGKWACALLPSSSPSPSYQSIALVISNSSYSLLIFVEARSALPSVLEPVIRRSKR